MKSKHTLWVGSRYRWRWMLVLSGFLAWCSIGCNPATFGFLFPEDTIQPEHKIFKGEKEYLFVGEKEVTVAVLCHFERPPLKQELAGADIELADLVAQTLRRNAQDNKHKLKIVPASEIRGAFHKQLATGHVNKVELGKQFKADYVLEMSIGEMTLYEKNTYPAMFRGNTDIVVDLYDVNSKDVDRKIYTKDFRTQYPGTSGPIDAGTANPGQFRGVFLLRIAANISKLFIEYPRINKHVMD
ncbi:MAG: hypothetical protein EXS16_14450 [Gemmataceae bacterium]|nr:hypothetical protein [Gemmataceae bacterium]